MSGWITRWGNVVETSSMWIVIVPSLRWTTSKASLADDWLSMDVKLEAGRGCVCSSSNLGCWNMREYKERKLSEWRETTLTHGCNPAQICRMHSAQILYRRSSILCPQFAREQRQRQHLHCHYQGPAAVVLVKYVIRREKQAPVQWWRCHYQYLPKKSWSHKQRRSCTKSVNSFSFKTQKWLHNTHI